MSVNHQSRDERMVGLWLVACCVVLVALVLVGGATRLTGSGLSMVYWQPLSVLPPLTESAWQAEFEAYRASPEYQQINVGMSLDEFKFIFWWEFGHRLLARGLGLVFALPLAWFWWRGMLPVRLRWPMLGLLALGGLQAWMGWYMVQSGLVDIPRVSPYRLAAHLGLALLILVIMLRLATGLLWTRPPPQAAEGVRRGIRASLVLGALTILSGAFVAGLKAGLVFNTFPLMGGQIVPPGAWALEPAWRNLFENPGLVQFIHRVLALATLAAVLTSWWLGRTSSDPRLRRLLTAVALIALVQVTLGITTLLMSVPIGLALVHQGTAVLLLGSLVIADFAAKAPWRAEADPGRPIAATG